MLTWNPRTLRDWAAKCGREMGGILEDALGIAEPMTIRLVTWSGDVVGEGTASFADTPILPNPKVLFPGLRAALEQGGLDQEGTIGVRHIPKTFMLADLVSPLTLAENQEFYYVCRGKKFMVFGEPQNGPDGWSVVLRHMH